MAVPTGCLPHLDVADFVASGDKWRAAGLAAHADGRYYRFSVAVEIQRNLPEREGTLPGGTMAVIESELTVAECRRVAQAFRAGSRLKPGSRAYVVMSRTPPLHRVQGIFATELEARRALGRQVPPGMGWSARESASRVVVACTVPESGGADEVIVCWHTEWTDAGCESASRVSTGLRLAQIESMELRVRVGGRQLRYKLPPHSIAVFVTRGAREAFLAPYYTSAYGREAAAKLLGTPRSTRRAAAKKARR
jgi:hypothetical protein